LSQPSSFKANISAWIEIQELPKHIAVVFRIALGGVLAWYATGQFNWSVFLITLLSVFFIADGAFISNEYFDYETDRINNGRLGGSQQGITSTGGTRVLVGGLIKRRQALIASIIFFMLAMPLGVILQYGLHTGPYTIALGAAGMLIGWFYTAPPVKAAYRGLGEIFMMLGYGLLIITIYYTQAGWSWLPVIVASTQFAAVPAIKLLRAFPDAEADASVGKRTLAVIFGKESMSCVYIILVITAIVLFTPAFVITRSPFAVLNFIPVWFLTQSLVPMLNGSWRMRTGLEQACRKGFMGLMLSPLTLTITFLLAGLFK
jgi:1,4-dihydroxy-2-naphthoate octaprenyltransferase